MPRGRHRHSPPLHRLLPPSAIAGVSFVCAFGPWVFSQQAVLRVIAAGAAATAIVGAAVMRRWDTQAGKQVADLTRARASDEWRHEERVAELETDLEESRELRAKLEQRLRAKRAELAGLRNEHAALLRRYATAETERASALEGRRLLEIETGAPARALPPVSAAGTVTAKAAPVAEETGAVAASEDVSEGVADEPAAPAIFSPEGSKLFLRAKAALKKFDEDGDGSPQDDGGADGAADAQDAASAEAEAEDGTDPEDDDSPKGGGSPKGDEPSKDVSPKGEPVTVKAGSDSAAAQAAATETVAVAAEPAATGEAEAAAQEDESQGQPQAVDGHERAAATTPGRHVPAAGHFVAPTAVAVVPAAPVRRPAVEGGFDFFGTKSEGARDALEAVQNEDLADVVGQEALAAHKAEAEFKPADKEAPAVGQVIDLTAHDETEQIDVQGLRSAVS
ncbi:hypothetical protein ACIBW9_15580 [Streptomyces sp. NPDC049541]|uniref:hypothetical protein n=1 Tax=Streptomyces sp. NPDC049541 TaxID=3365594 RepID=UPI0037A266D4